MKRHLETIWQGFCVSVNIKRKRAGHQPARKTKEIFKVRPAFD